MTHYSVKSILLFIALLPALVQADSSVTQAKSKLKELNHKIQQLTTGLASAEDKRGLLHHELANTEKQIGTNVSQLRTIQTSMQANQHKITTLQQQAQHLQQQLRTQQQLLAQHVITRYKVGEYQPLKWVINQEDPSTINRLLTFYQYLVHSRQQIIDDIDTTQKNLVQSQKSLQIELHAQQQLQQKLHSHQHQLQEDKRYHTAVIQTLNQDIHTKQLTLFEFQRDKENLSRLLKSLAAQSIAHPKQPFTQIRHKLPHPVHVAGNSVRRMNQGVTFFAGEGTTVNAVYPGKIVFSDWLKGYGLLLIIDHGQGFMTLYAHNQSLFKHKGANVQQGEVIAAVGHSGGLKQNGLYFEVRQRGKAVPPLEWLT